MPRIKLFFIIFLSGMFTAFPTVLTPSEALARLKSERFSKIIKSGEQLELKDTRYIGNAPVIYIFSRGEQAGFIALSANDNSVPLLGYSESGDYDEPSQLPDGLNYWLNSLGQQIAYNGSCQYAAKHAPERENIPALVSTTWSQDKPYNNDCPTLRGNKCVTGCVATAMAQALKYYNYPKEGKGTHSYYWGTGGQNLSFDYGGTSFQWENMKSSYIDYTQSQASAVAELMYACGVSVDMEYSPSASGATSYAMLRALIENFDYDQGIQYLLRDYYTLNEWEEMIYDNIKNFGPVIYCGVSNEGGHAFICDGYENGYFHFNWGWGGMSDGYFLLTALDPGQQGIGGSASGFNFNQDVILHLQTEHTSDTFFQNMVWDGNFIIDCEEAKLGDEIYFEGSCYNYSYGKIERTRLGLLFTDSEGEDIFANMKNSTTNLDPFYGFMNGRFNVTLPLTIPDGIYKVRPAFVSKSMDTPRVIRAEINNIGAYSARVEQGTVYFTPDEPSDIKASDPELLTPLYVNSEFALGITLTNPSQSNEFYGEIIMMLTDPDGNVAARGTALNIDIPAATSKRMEYISSLTSSSVNLPIGKTYQLNIYRRGEDGRTLEPIMEESLPVRVNRASKSQLTVTDFEISAPEENRINSSARIECNAGYYGEFFSLSIFPASGGSSIASFTTDFIAIWADSVQQWEANPEATIEFDVAFPQGEPGTDYQAAIYCSKGRISDILQFRTPGNSGVEEINSDYDNEITEYFDLQGIKLKESPCTPGMYIIRKKIGEKQLKVGKILIK